MQYINLLEEAKQKGRVTSVVHEYGPDDQPGGLFIVTTRYVPADGLLNKTEAATALDVTRQTIYRWLKEGIIEGEPRDDEPQFVALSEIKRLLEELRAKKNPTEIDSNLKNLPLPPLSVRVRENEKELEELRAENAYQTKLVEKLQADVTNLWVAADGYRDLFEQMRQNRSPPPSDPDDTETARS